MEIHGYSGIMAAHFGANMKVKIAIISDIHLSSAPNLFPRRGEIAEILLLRAVYRINGMIKPDLSVVLGDLIDNGNDPQAGNDLRKLKKILDRLESPSLILPGNHDGNEEAFYRVFPRPEHYLDIKGVRFAPFIDMEEPEYNARRSPFDLEFMNLLREDFEGTIVTVQHVPLFPPGTCDCPYNYTNAGEIIETMRRNNIRLAVGGHFHPGVDLLRTSNANFVAAPALCESPFSFLEIDLDGEDIQVRRHDLKMPSQLGLVDLHVHTQFAYCSENMEIPKAIALAGDFGLKGFAFAEHSGQLYFDPDTYWKGVFLYNDIKPGKDKASRMDAFFAALTEAGCDPRNIALETDCDFHGSPVVLPEDRQKAGFLIGAVHRMKSLDQKPINSEAVLAEFLASNEKLISSGIRLLAHPFRILVQAGLEIPTLIIDALVKMLRENKVAAEINFHLNGPPPEFLVRCAEAGVKLTLGSDSHNLANIGEFTPHLALLESCGLSAHLDRVLTDLNIKPL
jgi:histidinol phosphatase-like PHP family hydrolase